MKTWFYITAVEAFGSYSMAIRAGDREAAVAEFKKKCPYAVIASIYTR